MFRSWGVGRWTQLRKASRPAGVMWYTLRGGRLGLSGLDQLVAAQLALYHSRVESLASAAAQTDDDFARLVLEFRQGQLKAAIRWLDRCLETS